MKTTEERLKAYIEGKTKIIEELVDKRLKINRMNKGELPMIHYEKCRTATQTPVN